MKKLSDIIGVVVGVVMTLWSGYWFNYWVNHPELTHMQVFLKAIGMGS